MLLKGLLLREAAAPAMVGARPTLCACAAGAQGSPCCLRAPSAGQTPLQEQHLLPVGKQASMWWPRACWAV